MNYRSINLHWIATLAVTVFILCFLNQSFAGEVAVDTGVIKFICGRDNGGFIDEVYLDRDGDGVYSGHERIVLRPEDQAGLLVSYTDLKEGKSRTGVAVGPAVKGVVKIREARVDNLEAVMNGVLDFGTFGSTPFETRVRSKKKSAVLIVSFSFEPLQNAKNLLLREAALQIYGVFDRREPQQRIRRMSTGDFRNTPRPDSTSQYMLWKYGGHLVESPWYWRNWVSWSYGTGPQTIREGHTPSKELTFFMYDNFHGIQVALKEPAAVSPVELSGIGYPSVLSIYAWTPRVPGLDVSGDVPGRFYINETAIHFFKTDLENLFKNQQRYKKKIKEVLENSKKELLSVAEPVSSNLIDRRLSERLYTERMSKIAKLKSRGWAANVASVDASFSPVIKSSGLPYGDNWFKTILDVPSGVTGKNVPIVGGVPFPRGKLDSVENVRLIDGNGNDIAFQIDKLAAWPDGSVKWALLTAFVDLSLGMVREFRVEYGPEVIHNSVTTGKIEIEQNGNEMLVSNGVIKFTIRKDGSGMFDTLWFDRNGDGIYRENEKVFSSEGEERRNRMDIAAFEKSYHYGPYMYHADDTQEEQSSARVEDMWIERRGPLTAHIAVKGRYLYRKLGRKREENYKNKGNEFWIRFTVYSGKPYIGVKHSYVFEGNPDLEMIQDLSLSAVPNLGETRVFTAAIDERLREVHIQESEANAGVFMDNPYSGQLWFSGKSGKNEKIKYSGLKGNGWADISDDEWGVTFGVRHMREMYAKELSVDNGSIVIGLWPKRARYLDSRRYSRQFVSGESMSYGQGSAQGVARSHDSFFYFHNGDARLAQSDVVANYLLEPVNIVAYPEWYAKTEAAGVFAALDPGNNQQWEKMLEDGLEYFLYNRKLWAWYGIYDFGDLQQRPTWGGGWQKLNGRWGWVNNEALVDMWIYEQFFRTGKREYLDAALALSRHTMEVDLINSDNYKGNRHVKMHGHRHNVNHWGDGYVGIRVAAPQGFRLGYYLTGDLMIYDQLKRSMEAHWDSVYGSDRQHAAGLGLLVFFWETTGADVYKKALDSYLDYQVAHFRKFGHLHSGNWKFRKDQGRKLSNQRLSGAPTDFFFQNFGSAYSLMELADLTGRTDLIEALVRLARDTMRLYSRSWESRYCHYRLMAFAYRHTGDRTFLEYASAGVNKIHVASDRNKWSWRPAIESFNNKLSMLAWTGQGLPYLMKAVQLRKYDPVGSISVPAIVKMPDGKTMAPVAVDGTQSEAFDDEIESFEWWVDNKMLANRPVDSLELPPGSYRIELRLTDSKGRKSLSEKKVTVWEPGVVARLCFRSTTGTFIRPWEYKEEVGYGFLPGTKINDTAEPRGYGNKGCKEVRITGTVQIKTGPGVYRVEMGGKEFWTEQMGSIAVQGKLLDIHVKKAGKKKIEWGYAGEATADEDGLLKIDFLKGSRGEAVVLAYIIVKKYGR